MPILDGYESSKRIREFESQNNYKIKTLIIGCSGNEGDNH